MLYKLSKLVPVFMRSTYFVNGYPQSCMWIQWRGRVIWYKIIPV